MTYDLKYSIEFLKCDTYINKCFRWLDDNYGTCECVNLGSIFLIVFDDKEKFNSFSWNLVKDRLVETRLSSSEDLIIKRKVMIEVRGLSLTAGQMRICNS